MIGVMNMRLLTNSVKKWELDTYTLCLISHNKMEIAERRNMTLMDMMRSMMAYADLQIVFFFLGSSINCSIYLEQSQDKVQTFDTF